MSKFRIYQRFTSKMRWSPLLLIVALILSACPAPVPGQAPAAEAPAAEAAATEAPAEEAAAGSTDPMMTIYGETLPEDAVPYEEQVNYVGCSNTAAMTAFEFQVTVYQRYCPGTDFSDPLT